MDLKDYEIEEDCETEEGEDEEEEEETQGIVYIEGDVMSYGINKKENTNILIKLVKERELNSWKGNHVYEEVDGRRDMNIVNTKRIIKKGGRGDKEA